MSNLEDIFFNPNAPEGEGVKEDFVYEEPDDEFESPDVCDEFDYEHENFYTREVFETHQDLVNWSQRTANELGYVLVTGRSNANKAGEVKKVVLICNRGGKRDRRSTGTPKGTTKIECPFKLVGRLIKNDHRWGLEVVEHRHNHPSARSLEGIAYARRLTDPQKKFVDEKALLGLPPNSIREHLKAAFPGILTRARDISNYLRQNRKKYDRQEGGTKMQIVLQILSEHHYTYQYLTDIKTGRLTNIFFVHPTSLEMWRAFPWVIEIDATYKTNIYNMPLVEIVGVTPTGKTFSIAHALIENEKQPAYTWVLKCLRSTLDEGWVVRVAITDRDLALMNAVKEVMPETKLLLCRIHIWRNIDQHANPCFRTKKDYSSFKHWWDKVLKSITVNEYTENEKMLKLFLGDQPRLYNYIHATWLQPHKECFVSCWVDQHRNYRNYTTNRVEGQHALLKGVMHQKRLTFHRIVECVNTVVSGQYTEIKGTLEHSRQYNLNKHNYPFLRDLHGRASHLALQIMVDEAVRLKDTLKGDLSRCGCRVWSSCGLPCSCRIHTYMLQQRRVQQNQIDQFWCTLVIVPASSLHKNDLNNESDDDEPVEVFCDEVTTALERQPKSQRKNLMSRIKDIIYPGRSKIKDPEVQKKTRGRPTGSKKKVDVNVSPPMPPRPKLKKSRSVHATTTNHPDTTPVSGPGYRPFDSARHSDHVPTRSRFFQPEPVLHDDTSRDFEEFIPESQPSVVRPSNPVNNDPFFFDELFRGSENAYGPVPPTPPTGFFDHLYSGDSYYTGTSTSMPPPQPKYYDFFDPPNEPPMPAATSSFFDFFETPTGPSMPYTPSPQMPPAPAPSPTTPLSAQAMLDALGVPPHNTRPLQTINISSFLQELPEVFVPHVEGIINVKGDGNCGFRALAVALGYDEEIGYEWVRLHMLAEYENNKEWYDELTTHEHDEAMFFRGLSRSYVGGFRPRAYWMHMTMGAMLLSNRMGVVINCISISGSSTSFPFTVGPDDFPRRDPISIALVYGGSHYIMVQLQGEYPMAPEIPYWVEDQVTDSVRKWKHLYRSRQQAYSRYIKERRPRPIFGGTVG